MLDRDYESFKEQLKKDTGIDLSLYKESQMKRRLASLKDKKGFGTFSSLYGEMKRNKGLMDEVLDRITINVTEFFRNPTRWKVLEEDIFPKMIEKKRKIKCWSAACSSGEEPYTLTMILRNFLKAEEIEVVATDIDKNILERAMEGIYDEASLKNVSPSLVSKYFKKINESEYEISNEIKKMVTFKKQNLLNDSFQKGFDLIICRNVAIYFTEEAKEELYRKFSESLNPGGILFVGSTEQIFYPEKYNLQVGEAFFYEKK